MNRIQETDALNYKVQKWMSLALYSGTITWTGMFGIFVGIFVGGFNPIFKAGVTLLVSGNLWAYFCIAGMVKYYNTKIQELNQP